MTRTQGLVILSLLVLMSCEQTPSSVQLSKPEFFFGPKDDLLFVPFAGDYPSGTSTAREP